MKKKLTVFFIALFIMATLLTITVSATYNSEPAPTFTSEPVPTSKTGDIDVLYEAIIRCGVGLIGIIIILIINRIKKE